MLPMSDKWQPKETLLINISHTAGCMAIKFTTPVVDCSIPPQPSLHSPGSADKGFPQYIVKNASQFYTFGNVKVKVSKVKYVYLYSASSQSSSNVLPFPISRQANPTARHSANTMRPRIPIGVSHDMPVYFPSIQRVLIQPGQAQAEQAWVPGSAPRWFTRQKMITHLGTNWA